MQILVAYDGSELAGKALAAAADMAAGSGGAIAVVTVIPDLCLVTTEIGAEACAGVTRSLTKDAEASMAKATALLAERGLTARTIIASGRPADMILETARKIGADLVIVGSSGRHGAARLLLGSVSSAVAAHAGVSVLIVR